MIEKVTAILNSDISMRYVRFSDYVDLDVSRETAHYSIIFPETVFDWQLRRIIIEQVNGE